MKNIRMTALLLCAVLLLSGCGEKERKPVTVTIWHIYGGQTDSPLNDMIDEFNAGAGRDMNVRVRVGSVTNAGILPENVLAAANGDPGTDGMPDMFSSYADTVLALPGDIKLVDYRDWFSEKELAEFVPAFLEEGIFGGRLLILPVAKSAEVMFVNRTVFDRFASETGVGLCALRHWESLFKAAQLYAKWTDDKTPGISGDGKCMLAIDSHFDYFQVGAKSLGEPLFDGDRVGFGPVFTKVWEPYAKAALAGGLWLNEGYATEPLRTGDAAVSVGSSASVLYYSDTVTYEDNTSEKAKWEILPPPVFEGGEKQAMRRGAGICTVRSTPEKEKACMTFLRWLTSKENNVRFATAAGYMPVKKAAFDGLLPKAVGALTDPKYIGLYRTYMELYRDYTYYMPPKLDNYLDLQSRFEKLARRVLAAGRLECPDSGGVPPDGAERALRNFRMIYDKQPGG